jgi:dihydrofolate reductase
VTFCKNPLSFAATYKEKKMANQSHTKVRVYMANSLDGYIAGPNHDLQWLNKDHSREGDLADDAKFLQFDPFMEQVGCMLMGRNTYDVLEAMGQWVYGDVPVLVATSRAIARPASSTVKVVSGDIHSLISQAKTLANGKDVYIDGGNLIQQALTASLVDEMTLTHIPVLLAEGVRLFDNLAGHSAWQFTGSASHGGMLQVSSRLIRE